MRRAAFPVGCGLLLSLGLAACEGGGPPDNVPYVKTGGARRATQMGADVTGGTSQGTPSGATDFGPDAAVPGPGFPTAGIPGAAVPSSPNTGVAGFQGTEDEDFIGVDEIEEFDDFSDIQGFNELDDFGAGFNTPGIGTNDF